MRFGASRGATRFEDAGDRRRCAVAAGDEVLDGDTAQFVDQIGKPAQVGEGLHLGQRIEVEGSCAARSQNGEPVSAPKCQAIAVRR